MKYLKKYESDEYVLDFTYKYKTGYTEQELKDIFMLNLEDNTEFEILKFSTGKWPDTSNPRPVNIPNTVNCVLHEDFSNNVAVVNAIRESSSMFMKGEPGYIHFLNAMICGINKTLLDKIAKKYDLNITDIKLSPIQKLTLNNTAVVEFKIGKI